MLTETEIKTKYKAHHDELSKAYYSGTSGLTKEEFATQHGQIWADMETKLKAGGFIPEPEPPRSTHISTIDAIDVAKARPVRIKRTWEGNNYFYDCLATETVKDQYVAGKIAIGDYVIVHFDDIGEQVVEAKIFKSW